MAAGHPLILERNGGRRQSAAQPVSLAATFPDHDREGDGVHPMGEPHDPMMAMRDGGHVADSDEAVQKFPPV